MEGIRIAIGEMENTHSSIYREYGMFSAPFEYEIQVLLAILAPVPVSILINLFVLDCGHYPAAEGEEVLDPSLRRVQGSQGRIPAHH